MSETVPASDDPPPQRPLPVEVADTLDPQPPADRGGPALRVPAGVIDEVQLGRPRIQRRVFLPVALFVATCATTFAAGVYDWAPGVIDGDLWKNTHMFWWRGLEYMLAVMALLLAHEMGHFLMTVRYRIAASYPIFIPMPITLTGTMGAVIGMDGLRADRRQLFDIGLAGPLAGLVLTIPLVCIGLKTVAPSQPPAAAIAAAPGTDATVYHYGRPLLVKLLLPYLRPDLPPGAPFDENALYMAGWVGMLITGLNMMPVSQLDGGHIIYGLFGRRSRWIARGFLLAAIAAMVISDNFTWLIMLLLVIFLGADHPPTSNDRARLGPLRWLVGAASLAIPILCFTPTPLDEDQPPPMSRPAISRPAGIRSARGQFDGSPLCYTAIMAAGLAHSLPGRNGMFTRTLLLALLAAALASLPGHCAAQDCACRAAIDFARSTGRSRIRPRFGASHRQIRCRRDPQDRRSLAHQQGHADHRRHDQFDGRLRRRGDADRDLRSAAVRSMADWRRQIERPGLEHGHSPARFQRGPQGPHRVGAHWRHDNDVQCDQIMQGIIIPDFKNENYSGGILAGVEALDKMARGLALPAAATGGRQSGAAPHIPIWLVLVGIALAVFTVVSLIRSGTHGWSWLLWGAVFGLIGYLLYSFLTSSDSSSDSGGGFGGGSFGGGFSGGGGSTGSW